MLHYKTIDSKTLELLKKLQKVPEFSALRLVGGTALALQIGHRKSIDLDLFGGLFSDSLTINKRLNEIGETILLKETENIHLYVIDNIKVDIVNYSYEWLNEPIIDDGVILADKCDIAAMKLLAITGRGTKKDFVDLYFLLQNYGLDEILNFYKNKYYDGSLFLVLKSLSYFDDAEKNPNPFMLKPFDWKNAKSYIEQTISSYCNKNMN